MFFKDKNFGPSAKCGVCHQQEGNTVLSPPLCCLPLSSNLSTLLATNPELLRDDPFPLSKPSCLPLGEPCRVLILGGETLNQHLCLELIFRFSYHPRGSGRELEVLLLFNPCKDHFLTGQKNVYMPTRYEWRPTTESLWGRTLVESGVHALCKSLFKRVAAAVQPGYSTESHRNVC